MKWKKTFLTREYAARVDNLVCTVKWRERQWRATVHARRKPPIAVADLPRLSAAKRFCERHPAIVARATP